jgi:hypothetical protein
MSWWLIIFMPQFSCPKCSGLNVGKKMLARKYQPAPVTPTGACKLKAIGHCGI